MRTDERILSGATRLFRERGYHSVTVAEIGRAAGVSGPAIYKHFASKDELLAAIFNRAMAKLLSRLPAESATDPWDELDALVAGLARFARDEHQLVNIYLQERRFLIDPWRRTLRREIRSHVGRVEELIRRCRPDLGPSAVAVLAAAVNDMLFAIAGWPAARREDPGLEELARSFVRAGVRRAGPDGAAEPPQRAAPTRGRPLPQAT